MTNNKAFLNLVALHERAWGLETYKGRPTLNQILEAKVVAFWYPAGDGLPFTATIHKDLSEIEAYLKALVLHSKKELPRLRLGKVFMNKKEVRVKDIKIVFGRLPT